MGRKGAPHARIQKDELTIINLTDWSELVQKDGLELSLLVARAARPRDEHLPLLLELLDRRPDLRPRFLECLDGEGTPRAVTFEQARRPIFDERLDSGWQRELVCTVAMFTSEG